MGRSDDSITRRRNKKANRKQDGKSDAAPKVSLRVASIIASKKRRLSGKRRMCQGMCFSLPTLEDPFNDRKGKPEPMLKGKRMKNGLKKHRDQKTRETKGVSYNNGDVSENIEDHEVIKSESLENILSVPFHCKDFMGPEVVVNLGKPTRQIYKSNESCDSWIISKNEFGGEMNCPPKDLAVLLDSVQNAMYNDVNAAEKSLINDTWGLDFWNCYCSGMDILEIDYEYSTNDQIAWVASAAVYTVSLKKKDGLFPSVPFLLFLTPSQVKASKVRCVCKPFKAHGIRSVSLHSGATIDHQISGLQSCDPEILVSTPDRLLELLYLNAVDLSGVLLMVIEGFSSCCMDSLKSIRNSVPESARVVIFCEGKSIC